MFSDGNLSEWSNLCVISLKMIKNRKVDLVQKCKINKYIRKKKVWFTSMPIGNSQLQYSWAPSSAQKLDWVHRVHLKIRSCMKLEDNAELEELCKGWSLGMWYTRCIERRVVKYTFFCFSCLSTHKALIKKPFQSFCTIRLTMHLLDFIRVHSELSCCSAWIQYLESVKRNAFVLVITAVPFKTC